MHTKIDGHLYFMRLRIKGIQISEGSIDIAYCTCWFRLFWLGLLGLVGFHSNTGGWEEGLVIGLAIES